MIDAGKQFGTYPLKQ